MGKIFVLLFLIWGSFTAQAQEIQINEGPKIGEMVRAWSSNNFKSAKIDGWRVQVLSTTDRQQAETAKLRVASEFPDQYVDWVNEKPYYKLRVGACHTRNEAMALVQILKDYYPGAYPAQDKNISPRDFLGRP